MYFAIGMTLDLYKKISVVRIKCKKFEDYFAKLHFTKSESPTVSANAQCFRIINKDKFIKFTFFLVTRTLLLQRVKCCKL